MSTIADLKPDSRNARKHNPRNVGMIEASLQRDGFGRSILLASDGTIIAGNATIDAAAAAGIEDVLIVESDGRKVIAVKRTDIAPDSPEFHNLAIADNRSAELAEWNADVLTVLQDDIDLDAFFAEDELAKILGTVTKDGLTDPDDVPEVVEPTTKPGDLWLLGRHRLLCGDSTVATDVERLMAGQKADMVFTDPPYGVDYDGGSGNAKKRDKFNGDMLGVYAGWLNLWKLYATDSTPFYIWFADRVGRQTYAAIEDAGLTVRALIVWNKLNAHYGGYMAQYMQKHEPCLYCHIGTPTWYGPTNEVTVWDIEQPARNEHHPTQKPVDLAERAMRNSSKAGGIVLDLFLGSGTTLIAAEQLNRTCYGMEIDPHYCDVIVKRWQDFTGETAERETSALQTAAD